MSIACAPTLHSHPSAPRTTPCTGCGAACGPDDVLHLSSGRTAICDACWERWRAGGYGRTVRTASARVGRRQAKEAKAALLAGLERHERTVEL